MTDIVQALTAARPKLPELRRTIDLELALRAVPAEVVVPEGFATVAAARLATGMPAIDARALELDWAAVGRRIAAVATVVGRADERFTGGARELAQQATESAQELTVALLECEIADPLAALVLTHALRPWLRALAEVALPSAGDWTRGSCPCCGGAADFAVLEGEGGSRRLLCSRCDAEWGYTRVGCPHCENRDPATLAYFGAGAGQYRLYVCDACNGYIKTLDRRESFTENPLSVERVLAVGLDVAAAQAGYGPQNRKLRVLPS